MKIKGLINNLFKTKKSILLYLLLLFLLIRLVFLFTMGDRVSISSDYENRYRPLAHNILEGEEYGTGSDLEYPPIYPIFLAFNYTLFGDQIISIRIFQLFFDLVTCILLFFIANTLTNRRIGYYAMISWGLYPLAIWQVAILGSESLFTALIMSFMFLLILSYDNRSPLYAGFAGIILGVAMLTRPMMIYFPIFILIAYWINIRHIGTAIRLFSILLFGLLITLSPWITRNYVKYGEIITGTKHPDGQGAPRLFFEGSEENYVYAQGQYRYHTSDMKRDSLYSNHLKPGVSKNEILFNAAIENIISQPLLYLKLALYKIWKLFTFTVNGTYDIYIKIINVPIMVLSLFGVLNIRHRWKEFLAIILIVIYFISIYSLLISMMRYLMPVVPFIILFAAIGIDKLFTIINQRNIKLFSK